MTALRGLAAAFSGAAEGMGAGLVAEAKSAREEMLERLRMAHQSEEAQKGRDLTVSEGEKSRTQAKELQASNQDFQSGEGQKTRDFQGEQSGAQREDARNEGVLNRQQQKTIAELQIAAQKALKQMELDGKKDDPTHWVTGSDGSIYRPTKGTDGTPTLTLVKGSDGKDVRRAVSRTYVTIGSDNKPYADGEEMPEGVTPKMRVDAASFLTNETRRSTAAAAAEPKNEKLLGEEMAADKASFGKEYRDLAKEKPGLARRAVGAVGLMDEPKDPTGGKTQAQYIDEKMRAKYGDKYKGSAPPPAAETPPAADPPKPRRSLMPGGAEAPPAAGLSDGPPAEAPASSAPKPAAGGEVPRPDKMTDAQIIAAGKASLAQAAGRPDAAAVRAKIEARMRAWGVDPSALGK